MKAYAKLHRKKLRREDYRSAQICWMEAEMNRDKKKRPRPYKIEDFLLDPDDDTRKEKKVNLRKKALQFSLYLEQVKAMQEAQNG
tara:strand:- start:9293 stop:9547 length:255 start_codon:yes stop_codon:yes gene_type:complete